MSGKIEEMERRIAFLEDRSGVVYNPPEAEAGEWVEIDNKRRLRPDGREPQMLPLLPIPDAQWLPIEEQIWVTAYRKGREAALERVRELLEVIERPVKPSYRDACLPDYWSWLVQVQRAAKRVQL